MKAFRSNLHASQASSALSSLLSGNSLWSHVGRTEHQARNNRPCSTSKDVLAELLAIKRSDRAM